MAFHVRGIVTVPQKPALHTLSRRALLRSLGAFAGARLAVLLSGAVQLALLAIVMVAAAVSMLRRRREPTLRLSLRLPRRGRAP